MVPRVLVIGNAEIDEAELVFAADGPHGVDRVDQEPFDAVCIDLTMPPLDGWVALALLGARPKREPLLAYVSTAADIPRAFALGADICALAGTTFDARALQSPWPRHHAKTFLRPTTSGAHA